MTVILVDGNNALFRFGNALSSLQTSEGIKTGAVHGFFTCLLRLKKKFPGSKFVVVWDGGTSAWRRRLFPQYKQQVEPTPDKKELNRQIVDQIPSIHYLLHLIDIPQMRIDGVEADDLIGLLADACVVRNWDAIIYSTDWDFVQLIGRRVKLVRDVNKQAKLAPETETTIREKFRCDSDRILMVRAFLGDASDCIPSAIPKVGPVTAAKLVDAGVNPALESFDECCTQARQHTELKAFWKVLHRNYELMQLRGDLSHPVFNAHRWAIHHELRNIKTKLKMGGTPIGYSAMLDILVKLELSALLDRRLELFHLQKH